MVWRAVRDCGLAFIWKRQGAKAKMGRRTFGVVQSAIVIVLIFALVVVTSFLLHVLFSQSLTGLAVELLAAALAVVLVVASVGVTIHFQSKAETERQYRVCLFENKMKEYTKLLEITAKSDDDDKVDDQEIDAIRNQAQVAVMLAEKDLVVCLSEFIVNLETTRKLYAENLEGKGAFQQVVISMREDLGVVDGTTDEAKKAIRRLIRNPPSESSSGVRNTA